MTNNTTTDKKKYSKTLCLDDWFPNCNGDRTHALTVSQLLAIPEVKTALKEAEKSGYERGRVEYAQEVIHTIARLFKTKQK